MQDQADLLKRITRDPEKLGGKPIIRGRRLAVEHVLGYLAAGETVESLLENFPWLEREDILACMEFARRAVSSDEYIPIESVQP